MRQCTCGRSNAYPYCDGTHKKKRVENMKDGIIDVLDPSKFVILQDEVVPEEKAGKLNVYTNKICLAKL